MRLLKQFKSRKTLKSERDYYKEQLEKEKNQYNALKIEIKQIEQELENLKEENKKLSLEKTAMRNIIKEENIKSKRTNEKMQKRIDKLTGELYKLKSAEKVNCIIGK